MNKNKLIVFDIDGTLVDSVLQHQKAFSETLLELGVQTIHTAFKTFKHHTDSFIAKEIYETDIDEFFSEKKKIQFEEVLTTKISSLTFNEIKGAKKLIEKLQQHSTYGFCFATGSLRRAAKHKLNSIGIIYEDWQLLASDNFHERETIIKQAINNAKKHYQVEHFEQIISVGDGVWDLLAAKNLGLEFIGIGSKNKEILSKNGAIIWYNNLTQFALK